MKIFESIGTPGTALPRVMHVVPSVRWGVGNCRPIELLNHGPRRIRSYAGVPACADAQAEERDTVRRFAVSELFVLDGPAVKPAGVPLPRGKRSP